MNTVLDVMAAGFSHAEAIAAGAIQRLVGTGLTIPPGWLGSRRMRELLYRASRDGWRAADFHRHCDNKSATLTVVRCTDGFVFGGYTTQNWETPHGYHSKELNGEWLFVLKCKAGIGPKKMHGRPPSGLYPGTKGIYCSRDCGPCFGMRNTANFDMLIGDKPNENATNTIHADYSFVRPKHAGSKYVTGKYSFKAAEIEVYLIS